MHCKSIGVINYLSAYLRLPAQAAWVLVVTAALINPIAAASGASAGLPLTLDTRVDDTDYELIYTGRAERVFLFFKIYQVAHYADGSNKQPLSFETVITDERPKAILVRFDRKLDRERIREELAKSLRRNAREEWLRDADVSITAFINAIDRDAEVGDELVFFWLPEGRLLVEFNGKLSFEVNDAAFAKLIWSIWFGEDPACEREGLLAETAAENLREP